MQAFEKVELGLRIECRRRLVEEQNPRVLAHERPRQRDLLPFAAGKVDTRVEPLAERGVVARRQLCDELVRPGLLARAHDRVAVGDVRQAAEADVLGRRRLVVDVVLEHGADLTPQLGGVEVA